MCPGSIYDRSLQSCWTEPSLILLIRGALKPEEKSVLHSLLPKTSRSGRGGGGNFSLEEIFTWQRFNLSRLRSRLRLVMNAQRHVTRPPITLQDDESRLGATCGRRSSLQMKQTTTKVELFGPNAKHCVWRKTLHLALTHHLHQKTWWRQHHAGGRLFFSTDGEAGQT